ncbi:hypothetical protein P8452_26849 [Trifolium repens]|nr:hypothetical protein P8452_26849 [Trifolium repens]
MPSQDQVPEGEVEHAAEGLEDVNPPLDRDEDNDEDNDDDDDDDGQPPVVPEQGIHVITSGMDHISHAENECVEIG